MKPMNSEILQGLHRVAMGVKTVKYAVIGACLVSGLPEKWLATASKLMSSEALSGDEKSLFYSGILAIGTLGFSVFWDGVMLASYLSKKNTSKN